MHSESPKQTVERRPLKLWHRSSKRIRALSAALVFKQQLEQDFGILPSPYAKLPSTSLESTFCTGELIKIQVPYSLRPEFAEQYYDMISERILDVGLSVRKRVITISNKICTQQPNHPIVTKILLALISRINDEEQSIRDMVLKTFKGIDCTFRFLLNLKRHMVWKAFYSLLYLVQNERRGR